MKNKFDVIIIGAGLGGLLTGTILTKKGFKVAIIEKNYFVGGCLQSFKKDGVIFDTGIHYVGALGEGQVLNRLYKYLGVIPGLKYRKLDPDGFDKFTIGSDNYSLPSGYEAIKNRLISYFPLEKEGIVKYLDKIREIAGSVSLYNLEHTEFDIQNLYDKFNYGNAWDYIKSVTSDTKLQQLLASNCILYAGTEESSFLFVHALISNHYYEGSYRFVGGTDQVAKALTDKFIENGGELFLNNKAVSFIYEQKEIKALVTQDGDEFYADRFISNIHPYHTMELIGPDVVRKSYRKRIQELPNTISVFTLYATLEDGKVPYMNSNYYYYPEGNVWGINDSDPEKFPQGFGFYPLADSVDEKYTRGFSVVTFMDYKEVEQWSDTKLEQRGESYNQFKESKALKTIEKINELFPGIKQYIKSYTAATPLTLQDYTGTYRGSIYGIMRDFRNPHDSMLFPRTKIPNLYITGQNLSLHGFMGVSIGALLTCSEFTDLNGLLDEINHG
jgi:all-trans-retinol 13,14-reductase